MKRIKIGDLKALNTEVRVLNKKQAQKIFGGRCPPDPDPPKPP